MTKKIAVSPEVAKVIDKTIASIKNSCAVADPKKGLGFNMGAWTSTNLEDVRGRECGTVACLAGHVVFANTPR